MSGRIVVVRGNLPDENQIMVGKRMCLIHAGIVRM